MSEPLPDEPSPDEPSPDETGATASAPPTVRRRRLTLPDEPPRSSPPQRPVSIKEDSPARATTAKKTTRDAPTATASPASPSADGGAAKASGAAAAAARTAGPAKGAAAKASDSASLPPPPPSVLSPTLRKPQIGDSRPAPVAKPVGDSTDDDGPASDAPRPSRRRRRGGRGRGRAGASGGRDAGSSGTPAAGSPSAPVEAILADDEPLHLDDSQLAQRRGKHRDGKPVGRYRMCVHTTAAATHIAILEGRQLVEYYVSRPSDDINEIYGNVYLGKVSRVLPGMEAAFVDIGTPKQAVLYRGDLAANSDADADASADDDGDGASSSGADRKSPGGKNAGGGRSSSKGRNRKVIGGRRGNRTNGPRIEQMLSKDQAVVCQVVKSPIGHKGARLTTAVSLPGRYVVLLPGGGGVGISRQLPSRERRRLKTMLQKIVPEGFGIIMRTAAERVTRTEVRRDVERLVQQWEQVTQLAERSSAPALLFREPELAVRIIREQFTADYAEVVIDDADLHEQMRGYIDAVAAPLSDRLRRYDADAERLPLFERFHVVEQARKAVDRKVWLPSGGSIIIEHTEALTVIDVNTGRNVGKSSLNETIFRNNLEAATEIARQLRLRDIGGIIVVDFVDMDDRTQRQQLMDTFEAALARDKTRTSVEPISELGLVQMTRMRTGSGLVASVSDICERCEGRGVQIHESLLAL